MSGGSYDYLYSRNSLDELCNCMDDLKRMANDLNNLGYADDAARETRDIYLDIRRVMFWIEGRIERIAKVWKAMEWWQSSDCDEEEFKRVLMLYRGIKLEEE